MNTERLSSIPKSVIIVAPHTSNWDFVMGILAARSDQFPFKFRFIIKHQWNLPIIGSLLRYLGAIFVNRSASHGLTQSLSEQLIAMDTGHTYLPQRHSLSSLHLENRILYIALQSNLPISIATIDYDQKSIQIIDVITPPATSTPTVLIRSNQSVTPKHPDLYDADWGIKSS